MSTATSDATLAVCEEVRAERARQRLKFPDDDRSPFEFLAILGEEYGEACRAAVQADRGLGSWRHYRQELIHAAAVALAAAEAMDRSGDLTGGGR